MRRSSRIRSSIGNNSNNTLNCSTMISMNHKGKKILINKQLSIYVHLFTYIYICELVIILVNVMYEGIRVLDYLYTRKKIKAS